MVRRIGMFAAFTLVLLVTTGCFEIEEVIKIQEDLSGRVDLEVRIDMEEVLGPLLALMGDDGAEKQVQSSVEEQEGKLSAKVEELEADLPEGMRVISSEVVGEGLKMTMRLALGFDHVRQLAELRADGSTMPGLEGFEIRESGGQLEILLDAIDPGEASDAPSATPDDGNPFGDMMTQMVGQSFQVAMHVEAPFAVVQHNGTTQQGQRVSWTYSMADLEAARAAGEPPIRPAVVFRRGPPPKAVAAGKALRGKAEMRFVRVPAGQVTIDGAVTNVAAFDIATTEVTQLQYKKVAKAKPSRCEVGCGNALPVQNVSFVDAARFANRLSEMQDLGACYAIEGDAVRPVGGACDGFRLPTVDEWAHAARAGAAQVARGGWSASNSAGQVQAVATAGTNAWGLADLAGNVAEWVWADAAGSAAGGSFADPEDAQGADAVRQYPATLGQQSVGFRVVRAAN